MMADPYIPDPLDIFRDMDARGDFDPFEEEDYPICEDCGTEMDVEEDDDGAYRCLRCIKKRESEGWYDVQAS